MNKKMIYEEMVGFFLDSFNDTVLSNPHRTVINQISNIDKNIYYTFTMENYGLKFEIYSSIDGKICNAVRKPMGNSCYSFAESDINNVIFSKACRQMLDTFYPAYLSKKEKDVLESEVRCRNIIDIYEERKTITKRRGMKL